MFFITVEKDGRPPIKGALAILDLLGAVEGEAQPVEPVEEVGPLFRTPAPVGRRGNNRPEGLAPGMVDGGLERLPLESRLTAAVETHLERGEAAAGGMVANEVDRLPGEPERHAERFFRPRVGVAVDASKVAAVGEKEGGTDGFIPERPLRLRDGRVRIKDSRAPDEGHGLRNAERGRVWFPSGSEPRNQRGQLPVSEKGHLLQGGVEDDFLPIED
jgi:hypothetical protein